MSLRGRTSALLDGSEKVLSGARNSGTSTWERSLSIALGRCTRDTFLVVFLLLVAFSALWILGNLAWRWRRLRWTTQKTNYRSVQDRARSSWARLRAVLLLGFARKKSFEVRNGPNGEEWRWEDFRKHYGSLSESWENWKTAPEVKQLFADHFNTVVERRCERKVDVWQTRFQLGHSLKRASGPPLILLTFYLLSLEFHALTSIALPTLKLSASGSALLHGIGIFLFGGVLCTYLGAMMTPPGAPESGCKRKHQKGHWCHRCEAPKQPEARTHHCAVCDRCVLKMDHHCPWIHNCVGLYNYIYFFFFLVFAAFSAVFTGCMLFPAAVDSLITLDECIGNASCEIYSDEVGRAFHTLLATFLAVTIALILVPFSHFHFRLVLTNMTTVEYVFSSNERQKAAKYGMKFVSKYDRGWRQNLSEFFFRQINVPKTNVAVSAPLKPPPPPPTVVVPKVPKKKEIDGIVGTSDVDPRIGHPKLVPVKGGA